MISNLTEEIKTVRAAHPSWSFQESWNFLETIRPALFVQSSAESNRIQAKLAPQLEREKWKTEARIEAEARALMAKDPRLPFGVALVRAREQHPGEAPAGGLYLVTAHSVALSGNVPQEIMYMPQGKTVLTPSVNGKAKTISVNVTRATADLLQSDLEKLLKQNVPPIICFDHSETRAAAIPKRFTWREGQGVFLTVDWTSSGQSAVAGHDYGWLSPTFMMNGDGELAGLPQSGGSIGSLTNRPAFQQIRRIHS